MKVERISGEFKPVVITIESEKELRDIVDDLGKGHECYDLFKQLSKILDRIDKNG